MFLLFLFGQWFKPEFRCLVQSNTDTHRGTPQTNSQYAYPRSRTIFSTVIGAQRFMSKKKKANLYFDI